MYRRSSLALLVALFLPGHAAASCIEQQENLRFDEDTVSTVKSYLCTVGSTGDRLRITFYQLSGVASGMVLGHSPMTAGMESLFGSYRLNENIVGLVYSSLFENFASSFAVGSSELQLVTKLPTETPDDFASLHENKLRGGKVKAIVENPSDAMTYPISTQLAPIADGKLPPGMHFYYWGFCDQSESGEPDCRQRQQVQMVMWRGMTPTDLADYKQNLSAEKDLVMRDGLATTGTSSGTPDELRLYDERVSGYLSGTRKSGTESYLEFVHAVAGDAWPQDFLTLRLTFFEEGCAEGGHWSLSFVPRDMRLGIARVTNESNRPINIDGLLGTIMQSADLRPVKPGWSPAPGGSDITIDPVRLAPGESLVIPTQIRFPAPESGWPEDIKTSNALFQTLGSGSLSAKGSDYGFPRPRDYAYGPEIELSGVRANGKNVELVPRTANFVEMIASYEEGSCPFLVAWDGDDREWVDHGKILHAAKGKPKQQTETISFAGFRSRFRLEEREPEVAPIDAVALDLLLRDGTTRTLRAAQQPLAQSDGAYLHLFRDEAVEVVFDLPDGVDEDDVVESRISVTGFYQPYAQIRVAQAAVPGAISRSPMTQCPMPATADMP